ncbi:hypothetical protein [Streptomyces sp. SID10815]|uniref:hypothetical protein n=1 Tax=Streptomyces sp. SID10815 TaxID=2706027 RepID=UPI0013C7497B|nr:hypothetical protein [Streptomyces sp. SID10815]NEA46711.1 hypothetical protein [Streptomyces sp. SID10815]
MSEYQHYQFSVDEPLTDGQLAEIRALTTRARLTRHSFVNTYDWGDFKGNARRLVETRYDAHLLRELDYSAADPAVARRRPVPGRRGNVTA